MCLIIRITEWTHIRLKRLTLCLRSGFILQAEVFRLCSSLIQEKAAQFQIFLFASYLIQTNKCHLCDFMSRIPFALADV